MKVRAGKFRGSRLKMEKGRKIRPATSRVKTAIFDILPMDLSDAVVLDLFAGSGSLGIEALSRGAAGAVFVDQSRGSGELIKANLLKLGCFERGDVMVKKVAAAINHLSLSGAKFHLIFVDPPFDQSLAGKTLAQIERSGILAREGIAVVRTSTRERPEKSYGELKINDRRKYGDSMVSFYVRTSGITEKEEA
jgi:16S rRNA (guanine966-N2)-methyltransferase